MRIADAHGEGVTITLEVIKAHDYVMQPVWSVENAIVAIEDLGKLGIVCWRESRCDSVGKTHQERIAGSFERVDVAQLIGRSAGKLRTAVRAQSRRADSLRFRRVENAVEEWGIEPLKFIGGEDEELVFYDGAAQAIRPCKHSG